MIVSSRSGLVLTSATAGSSGVEMLDDGNGTLQALGLTDGTTVTNRSASGATQTNRLSSSTAAIATLLGIPLPGPSSLRVNGQVIHIDLSVDSLATVAQKINAASGWRTPVQAAWSEFMLKNVASRDFSVIVLLAALLGWLDWFLWMASAGSLVFTVLMLWVVRPSARSRA